MTRAIQFSTTQLRDLIESQGPIVALETAVLTHGLSFPTNVKAVEKMISAVRGTGAVPVVIGVIRGTIVVGMSDEQIESLAQDRQATKASALDLALTISTQRSAGLTVAGTLAVCNSTGIRVLATGGIGGVHHQWRQRLDVSADLRELANTQCCVVCSGAKSIVDTAATLEVLEALGVSILRYRTDLFPQFISVGSPDEATAGHRVDETAAIAQTCRIRWMELGQPGGILLANPIPTEHALDHREVEQIVAEAVDEASRQEVSGPALTPFLLAALARRTDGRSVAANLALLESNAALAGRVAVAMSCESDDAGESI